MDGLGCSPAQPKRFPAISSPLRFRYRGNPARVRRSSIQAGPPPKLGGLGWIGHLARQPSSSPCDPSHSTMLGGLARRMGLGCRVAEPNTHTRTGSKTSSADPLLASQTQAVFLPVTEGWHHPQKGVVVRADTTAMERQGSAVARGLKAGTPVAICYISDAVVCRLRLQ